MLLAQLEQLLIRVCGVNKQLFGSSLEELITQQEITDCPDFIANSGGVIIVSENIAEDLDYEDPRVLPKLDNIYNTIKRVLLTSDMYGKSTSEIANIFAEDLWKEKK